MAEAGRGSVMAVQRVSACRRPMCSTVCRRQQYCSSQASGGVDWPVTGGLSRRLAAAAVHACVAPGCLSACRRHRRSTWGCWCGGRPCRAAAPWAAARQARCCTLGGVCVGATCSGERQSSKRILCCCTALRSAHATQRSRKPPRECKQHNANSKTGIFSTHATQRNAGAPHTMHAGVPRNACRRATQRMQQRQTMHNACSSALQCTVMHATQCMPLTGCSPRTSLS